MDKWYMSKQNQIKALYFSTLILFLPMFVALFFLYTNEEKTVNTVSTAPDHTVAQPVTLDVPITASSAIMISLNTNQVVFEKFPERQLSLASITKLMTALVADETVLQDQISISKVTPEAYSDFRLLEGDTWTKDDLIKYTLITSSNDGAHSLKESSEATDAFVNQMNQLASTIGLTQTHFYNETGLDDENQNIPGSKGTARDISKLLGFLIHNKLDLYEVTQHSQTVITNASQSQVVSNTNESVPDITGLLLSKTGYTDLAGGNLAIVADMGLNEPMAFVVLRASRESRFEDVVALQEAYFTELANKLR